MLPHGHQTLAPATKKVVPGANEDDSLIRDELLHELFEAAADSRPDHTAVECGAIRLTYRELEERANRLAHTLRARGIGREDCVAILLPRSEAQYIALLAVLKAGAAYIPLDPDTPADRVRFILEDSGAKCLITLSALSNALQHPTPFLCLDTDAEEIARHAHTRMARHVTGASPKNLCYVIYTSGTTGRPKGVQIEHRNVTHLVRAESQLYKIHGDDRIFQLASLAFDASVEEIWMAFSHGATLIAGTTEIIRSGPEFSGILERLGATVLSCVPTFLSMLDRDIPAVRLLILGGEACPPGLADRWQAPGRIIYNTYGPTEATVIASAAVLESGQPVTIGRPITNYRVYLLDDDANLVPVGAPGEICIGGPGVARGYLNRPELNATKFIVTDALTGTPLRLYRTADQARWTPDAQLEYLGRLDDQVKLRGYRIELAEIESALAQFPGVLAAAAAVHAPTQQIAAYIMLQSPGTIDRAALRQALSDALPPYMVPAFLDEVPSLPMTPSGKIDRKNLPEPHTPLASARRVSAGPRTAPERVVMEVWRAILQRQDISIRDDFFLDLDGHSLLAAATVSELRKRPVFERLSVADLYANPTVEALARLAAEPEGAPPRNSDAAFHHASSLSYFACAAGQALGIVFIAGLYAWQWLGAYLTYGYLVVADWRIPDALVIALIVACAITPVTLTFSIAVKWLLLGRIRPGRYPLWGWFYWRFWFVRALIRAAPVHYLDGTPLLNLYYRLMGAQIGRDVFIGSFTLTTFDVFTVGNGSSIGINSSVDGASVEGGMLRIEPVTIGSNCWVGSRCALGAGSVLEDGTGLDDLSMLSDGARVPAGHVWQGSPAVSAGRMEPAPARAPWSPGSWIAHVVGIALLPLVIIAAFIPGVIAITHLGHQDEGYFFLFVSPLVAISFVVFLSVELWLFKWLLIGRLAPGCYPVGGFFYVRTWFVNQLMAMSTDVTEALYETLYVAPWLRSMGARIGPRCEIAAIELVHPDLLEMEGESMIADLGLIGPPHVRSGWLTLGSVRIGRRVFIGNSAILPSGAQLESNVLIGLMSLPPKLHGDPVPEGTSWFGSPPIQLPMRYRSRQFSEAETYRPPQRLYVARLVIELFRIFLPPAIFVALAALIVDTTDILQDYIGFREWLLTAPFLYVAAGIGGIFITLLIKWLMAGRYRAGEWPLWSPFVWRNDLVNGLYSNFCEHFFLTILRGTPFLAWALRAFGMKIGRRCYIDSTWYTEFDLIELGDDVALNEGANIQTHLFEDRIIKVGPVHIGNRCVVGAASTVLYNTRMEDGAIIEDLSLLMKGETLPAGTRWSGIPARRSEPAVKASPEPVHTLR